MKAAVIIAILAALAVAASLYGVLVYVTRGYIQQDRQADATAPCEPVGVCETCSLWGVCGGQCRHVCEILEKKTRDRYMRPAPAEPADPCETCNRWDECNGVDREYCPLWQDNEEATHAKEN